MSHPVYYYCIFTTVAVIEASVFLIHLYSILSPTLRGLPLLSCMIVVGVRRMTRVPILIVVAEIAVMILFVPSTFTPVLTTPVPVGGGVTMTTAVTVTVRTTGVATLPAASVAQYVTVYVPAVAVLTMLVFTTVHVRSLLSTQVAPASV